MDRDDMGKQHVHCSWQTTPFQGLPQSPAQTSSRKNVVCRPVSEVFEWVLP